MNGPDWPARIRHLMTLAPLSYSLVILQKDKIYGVRDPYGNRPLCIGKILPLGKLGKFSGNYLRKEGANDRICESLEKFLLLSSLPSRTLWLLLLLSSTPS